MTTVSGGQHTAEIRRFVQSICPDGAKAALAVHLHRWISTIESNRTGAGGRTAARPAAADTRTRGCRMKVREIPREWATFLDGSTAVIDTSRSRPAGHREQC